MSDVSRELIPNVGSMVRKAAEAMGFAFVLWDTLTQWGTVGYAYTMVEHPSRDNYLTKAKQSHTQTQERRAFK